MKAHELLRQDWKATSKGFRVLPKGKIVWKSAEMNGDRRRVKISRKVDGVVKSRYVSPHTNMELVPR